MEGDNAEENVKLVLTTLHNNNMATVKWEGSSQSRSIDKNQAKQLANELLKPASREFEQLLLAERSIGDEGVVAICEVLMHPSCECHPYCIDVGGNNIGIEGIKAIATLLSHPSCPITELYLQWNPFGDEGIEILCKVLDGNSKLVALDIYDCNIHEKGAKALLLLFQRGNYDLEYLYLWRNEIEEELATKILGYSYLNKLMKSLKRTCLGDNLDSIEQPLDSNFFTPKLEDFVEEEALEFVQENFQPQGNIPFPSRFRIAQPRELLHWKLSFVHIIIAQEIGKSEGKRKFE